MKKIMSLIVVSVLALGLFAGCGEKEITLNTVKTSKYVTSLGQYKGVAVEAKKTEVTDELMDYFNEYFYTQIAMSSVVDYAAKNGDTVVMDYVGKIDGEAFEGGTAMNSYLTLGSHSFIDGFEDALIGVKAGETRDVEVSFPDDYTPNPDLSGKPAVFTCTVHSVIPVFGEEGIKLCNSDEFGNMEEYKAFAKEYLTEMSDSEYREKVCSAVLDQVIATSKVEKIPQQLIDLQIGYISENFKDASEQYNLSVADILSIYYQKDLNEMAAEYATRELICQAIANVEKLTVSDEELDTKALENITESGEFETIEAFYEAKGREDFRNYLMCEKVYDFLVENAYVVEPQETSSEGGSGSENSD